MEVEPANQPQHGVHKVVYWLLGLLIVGIVFGGATFLYVSTNNGAEETVSTTTTPKTTSTVTSTELASNTTDITDLMTDLDKELASIDGDLASTEDETSDL